LVTVEYKVYTMQKTDYATALTLPNLLTLARLASVPILVLVFFLPFKASPLIAAVIFAVAGITDAFDGYLARKMKLTSRFGAFIDPVADKLMVAVALMLLVHGHKTIWMTIPALVIISREILVSALREWMAELGKRANVAVSAMGKIKTILQIVAITMLLYFPLEKGGMGEIIFNWQVLLSYVLLYAATFLTLSSMYQYLRAAWKDLWASEPKV